MGKSARIATIIQRSGVNLDSWRLDSRESCIILARIVGESYANLM